MALFSKIPSNFQINENFSEIFLISFQNSIRSEICQRVWEGKKFSIFESSYRDT